MRPQTIYGTSVDALDCPPISYDKALSNIKIFVPTLPKDIVIAVMGVTGSGKSTFINHFNDKAVIGHELESCTSEIGIFECTMPNGKPFFLIDTPGFDDTYREDVDILRELANFLTSTYENKVLLTGIVLLHRIGDVRVGGSSKRYIRMVQKLCGNDSLKNVALATTMWSLAGSSVSEQGRASQHEEELQTKPQFWKPMIDRGSRVFRHDRGEESALEIVKYLMSSRRPRPLDIQKDMVDRGFSLSETAAAKEVEAEKTKQSEMYEKKLAKMREEMEEAIREKDSEWQKELQTKTAEMKRKKRESQKAIQKLKVTKEQLQAQMQLEWEIEKQALEQKLEKKNRQLMRLQEQREGKKKSKKQQKGKERERQRPAAEKTQQQQQWQLQQWNPAVNGCTQLARTSNTPISYLDQQSTGNVATSSNLAVYRSKTGSIKTGGSVFIGSSHTGSITADGSVYVRDSVTGSIDAGGDVDYYQSQGGSSVSIKVSSGGWPGVRTKIQNFGDGSQVLEIL